jgi:putative superfamily III holin-X
MTAMSVLDLLLAATRLAIARPSARAAMARIVVSCLLVLLAVVLALTGLGFGLYAAFVALSLLMPPAAAAATVATAMAMAAAILILVAFRRPRKRGSGAHTAAAEVVGQWVRANPGQATAAAIAIGFIVGSRR